jgi:uncharacterized protein
MESQAMPISQLLPDIYVPTFEMQINGTPLELNIAKTILDVSVTEVSNQSSAFSFQLNDPTLTLINREHGLLTEGKQVEISLGYVGKTKRLIVGEITALTAEFPSSGPATVHVEGFDLLHTATRGTADRPFNEGQRDSDIVVEIASKMGLTPSVDPTAVRTGRREQHNITALKFLEQLAEANGYFLWVEDKTLFFKKARLGAPIRLEWGKTLMSFSLRLSTAGHVDVIKVRGWDPVQKQSIAVRAQRTNTMRSTLAETGQQQIRLGSDGRSERVIACGPGISSAQEAQTFADAKMAEQQRGLITGGGTSIGDPDIRVGTILDLQGIGRFNGNYVVEQVTHTVSDSGYQTSFQVRQPA